MKLKRSFASRLRHQIEIIFNGSEDGLENWVVLNTAFAEITEITETNIKEFDDMSFGHILSEEYFIITTRYLKNINTRMRVKFGDRIFAIKKIVNPFQLNHLLKILAVEVTEQS